jgi:heme/copper-type cytochrome/quinol oxidase subunit 3
MEERPSPFSNAKVAGVLCIIAGVCALFGSFVLAGIGAAGFAVLGSAPGHVPHGIPFLPLILFIPMSVLVFALGVVAVTGGIAGVRRDQFWLLIVGAATAIFCVLPVGVVALVFALLAEKEFGAPP